VIIRNAIRLGLGRRQANGDPAALQRGLVLGVPHDDHAVRIDHARLANPNLLTGRGDGVDRRILDPGVVLVGPDVVDRSHFDRHGQALLCGSPTNALTIVPPACPRRVAAGLQEKLRKNRLDRE
jgi:hypothetical protein